MPESPRWLLSINKVENARRVIEKIAKLNTAYENLIQTFRDRFCRGDIILFYRQIFYFKFKLFVCIKVKRKRISRSEWM